MVWFITGIVIFFGVHLFSAFRNRTDGHNLRQSLGEPKFMALFSIISLVGFILMVWGFGQARLDSGVLYTAPVWGRHLNYILMPVALILLVSAYAPTGHIAKAVKHPMVLATKIWAFGHLLANGEVTSVILFGSSLAYGVVSRIAAKRRGDIGAGAVATVTPIGDLISVGLGLGLSAALILYLHPLLFGVAVWPPA